MFQSFLAKKKLDILFWNFTENFWNSFFVKKVKKLKIKEICISYHLSLGNGKLAEKCDHNKILDFFEFSEKKYKNKIVYKFIRLTDDLPKRAKTERKILL